MPHQTNAGTLTEVNSSASALVTAEEDIFLRYNPEAISAYYSTRPWQVAGRSKEVFGSLSRYFGAVWLDKKWGREDEPTQRRRAIELRDLLTKLGPAFIKIGQAVSTRPDLVPPIYLEELSKLQDQIPPFDNEIAFRYIEEALGARPEEIFVELSESPIAAASLGQVYKGRLKTGESVAVKVQRPGLAELITLDVYILRGISAWAMKKFPAIRSDLVGILDEFAERIFEEMDYTHEGRNAERFDQLYSYMPEIYVPEIYWDYTSRRVLTMEWIEGTKLTQIDAIMAQGIDATALIEVGVQCSLRQLLEHGFFHADPHPGNLLAMPDGRLAYLDFGMMSQMEPYQRYGLIEAIVHLVNRDFESLASDYVKLEFLSPEVDLTPIIPAFAQVFSEAMTSSVSEINIKTITDKLSELMYEYPFKVPAYFALIIRSLVTLEGIAINIDPEFKVLTKAYPYVAKRLLTDPAPELRSSLKSLLFRGEEFRWNRLENLLNNAKGSREYDLSRSLDQSIDYLFSERGDDIRNRLAEELIRMIDGFGQSWLGSLQLSLGQRFGFAVDEAQPSPEADQAMGHVQRIWGILQETEGVDPNQILPVLPKLLFKPEAQELGQRVANGVAQRALARFVREIFLRDEAANAMENH
ncbi:AarF/ABC1/UbiB kinase family protein [filamentous cyanobacterium LEGE 11480]|uniref:AarF/ABC1/UbiB kinase family protein n=1 Tax=Romeriopsis navalis LEGE 11480 TaxID=2777977 RepID=A0A928VHG7_9CYAN|nr:AarF/UbiB family protein [Romeriopsis navalis]MBE9028693.1 AarF/ABC1/UbiB kinase family protein [Romeriopsis navalis LEGE 11480]